MTDRPTFATIDPDRIGRIKWGTVPDTPKLPKPFVPLRVFDATVYHETGELHHKGKLRLYMDPRGDVEFAVGVYPWMEKLLGSKLARRTYGGDQFGIQEDGQGSFYVLGTTAAEARDKFHKLQTAYAERLKLIGGKVYLGVFFSCAAPVFINGVEQEPDSTIDLGDSRRRRSRDISMSLRTERGVLIDKGNDQKFYPIDESGKVGSSYRSKDVQCVYLEDTPENNAAVDQIRMALAQAADMMDRLFGQSAEDFLIALGNGAINGLPAPMQPPEPPPVQRIRRTR